MAPSLRINASTQNTAPSECALNPSNTSANSDSIQSRTYVHVHFFTKTDKWGAWFNDPRLTKGKRRLYFGAFDTEYQAARAQDRAALKFMPDAVQQMPPLNFKEGDYNDDKALRKMLTHEQFRRLLMAEGRSCYSRSEPSPCWRKFLAEEAANIDNLPKRRSKNVFKPPRPFTKVLEDLMQQTPRVTRTPKRKSGPVRVDNSPADEAAVRTATRTKQLTARAVRNQAARSPRSPAPSRPIREATAAERARPVRKNQLASRFGKQTARSQLAPTPEPPTPAVHIMATRAGLRRAEEEVRGSPLQTSQQSSGNLHRLAWTITGKRTTSSSKFSSPSAGTVVPANNLEHLRKNKMPMVSFFTGFPSEAATTFGTSDENESGSEITVQSPTKRRRINIDLNREPDIDLNREPVNESFESLDERPPHVIGNKGVESTFLLHESLLLLAETSCKELQEDVLHI